MQLPYYTLEIVTENKISQKNYKIHGPAKYKVLHKLQGRIKKLFASTTRQGNLMLYFETKYSTCCQYNGEYEHHTSTSFSTAHNMT